MKKIKIKLDIILVDEIMAAWRLLINEIPNGYQARLDMLCTWHVFNEWKLKVSGRFFDGRKTYSMSLKYSEAFALMCIFGIFIKNRMITGEEYKLRALYQELEQQLI